MWKSRQTIRYGDIIKLRSPICVKHDVVDIFVSEEKYERAKSVEAFLPIYERYKNLYFVCLPRLFEYGKIGDIVKEKEIFRAVSTDGTVIYLFPFQCYKPDSVEKHILDSLLEIKQKQYGYKFNYTGVEENLEIFQYGGEFRNIPISNYSTSATTIGISNYSTTTTGASIYSTTTTVWSTDYNIRWV